MQLCIIKPSLSQGWTAIVCCLNLQKIKIKETRLISIVSKPIEFYCLLDEYLVFKKKGFFCQDFFKVEKKKIVGLKLC